MNEKTKKLKKLNDKLAYLLYLKDKALKNKGSTDEAKIDKETK